FELGAVAVVLAAVAGWAVTRAHAALWAVGLTSVAAMTSRVLAGHAGGGSHAAVALPTQALHFVAVGAWAGALPHFAIALRGASGVRRAALARRFSAVAAVGFGVV